MFGEVKEIFKMIKVKLPRKAKGQELAKIIEEFMNSQGYKIRIKSERNYVHGSVKLEEVERHIAGNKYLVKNKILRYLSVDPSTISTSLKMDQEYDELNFDVWSGGWWSIWETVGTLQGNKQLKDEFEGLVGNIYAALT